MLNVNFEAMDLRTEIENIVHEILMEGVTKEDAVKELLNLHIFSFDLPSDDIFDMQEVNLKNPLEEFYYYERPAYLEDDQKQFRERLQKALNYLKGN